MQTFDTLMNVNSLRKLRHSVKHTGQCGGGGHGHDGEQGGRVRPVAVLRFHPLLRRLPPEFMNILDYYKNK